MKFYRDKMILRKAYTLLFVVAFLLLIYSFYSNSVQSYSLNIADTFYVISNIDFYRFYAALLLILGLLYFTLDRTKVVLLSLLSLLHIFGTLVLYLLLIYFNYQNSLEYQGPTFHQLNDLPDYNSYIIITLLIFIFLQILFIINIFVSIIKNEIASQTRNDHE